MPYPPDLIVDNETVPVPLPAVTARLIVSSEIAGSVSFLFLPFPPFSFLFLPLYFLRFSFRVRTLVSPFFLATFAFLSKTNFVSSVRQTVSYWEFADTREPNRRISGNYKFESFSVLHFKFQRSRTSRTFVRRSSKRVRFGKTDWTLSRVWVAAKGTNPRTSITLFSVVRRISHRPRSLDGFSVLRYRSWETRERSNVPSVSRTLRSFTEHNANFPTKRFISRDA